MVTMRHREATHNAKGSIVDSSFADDPGEPARMERHFDLSQPNVGYLDYLDDPAKEAYNRTR